ncbi:phosphate ABC transporter membrane protein 1, PhoT family [Desulfonispora thiosulfatigenes DSM 11270]|uniref:Phosphate transport system permease protein n=1 Tax=Desulfonispora thiosulfatigenes DSM 11270 TaxID=656914 RepID=A0A1W1VEJ5_DESTI|nr:phosphate ABC transporter permease subunit PstC [Desulfonispora thiosulfatigenes]SMB91857.1 phosphate ABC transporter membrane protein 1, PhoT family [Desulfonispora thiosulfatigenes DSM 11270]
MRKTRERIFNFIIKILSLISLFLLAFIIIFIFRESLSFFMEVPILKFVSGRDWNPLDSPDKLSILPIIAGTIYTSLVGIIIALPIGVGFSVVLSSYTSDNMRRIIRGIVDILAGIPSVVYGFIGLLVLVKFFEIRFSFPTGESILAGGIILSIMMLPYIISTCDESMEKVYKEHSQQSNALGVSKSYMIRNLILPKSKKCILAAVVLALGRGMGETMAVMMVIGNAPLMPRLLDKGQTIPSLIALEMGMAEVGSLHYHALFASGFILMIILIVINIALHFVKLKIEL